MIALLLCLVSIVQAEPAVADPVADLAEEADLHFRLGVDAYRRGDWSGALEHLLLSNRLAPNRNVVFNIARAYEQMGRYSEAFRHYVDYLALETDLERRASAEQALARIRPRVAVLRVESDPPGATIYVDRKELGPRGSTPRLLALDPGPHTVLLEAPGFEPVRAPPAQLVVGEEALTGAALVPVTGRLEVASDPPGAEVHLGDRGGPVLGQTPGAFDLPPGPQTLVVVAPGRRVLRLPVDVRARATQSVTAELEPIAGAIVVNALEKGALIEVDGEAAGFTPGVVTATAGRHVVRVSQPGFRTFEQEIDVPADGRVAVEARLRPVQEVTAASRTTQAVEDAPASVTVITAEELRAFHQNTLVDALTGLRGVIVSNDLTYDYVGFRGFQRPGDYNSRVLVTVDGHAMNDDQLGASYVGYDLLTDLSDVERIEVVRGPGSALYGSSAFFGVINIVTRRGDGVRPASFSVATDASGQGRARAGASGQWGSDGGWYASAGGLVRQSEEAVSGVSGPGGWAAGARGLVWKGDLTLQGQWNGRDQRIVTGAYESILGDGRAHTQDLRGFVELRWEPSPSEQVDVYTRAWLDRYHFRGAYPYDDADVGLLEDRWDGTWTGLEARVAGRPTSWLTLTGGGYAEVHTQADMVSEDASGVFLEEREPFQVYAGYAVADVSPVDALSASLGARVDHFTTFGTALNPRAAVIVRPAEAHTLKLLAGRAFRAPSVYELRYADGVSQVAAPDLGAETILTGELEYSWRFNEVGTAIVAVYANEIDGLIDLRQQDDARLRYANSDARVRTAGVEVELRRAWRQGWMLTFNQGLSQSREGDLFTGEPLTNAPVWSGALRAVAPIVPNVSGSTRIVTESGRRTRGGDDTLPVILWDVNVTGLVPAARLDWAVGLRNLLDWRYALPAGEEIPSDTVTQAGRTFMAEVGYTF